MIRTMAKAKSWKVDGLSVYPLNDLREHDIESPDCWCNPFYEDDILVHNSMDEREQYEQGRKMS